MTLKIENATAVNFDKWKDLMTTTTHTVKPWYWIDAAGKALSDSIDKGIFTVYDEYPIYTDGTKLLRDFAQLSNDYAEKKAISRFGWKTRREIRNV